MRVYCVGSDRLVSLTVRVFACRVLCCQKTEAQKGVCLPLGCMLQGFRAATLEEVCGVASHWNKVLGHFQVGSYRYRSLIEGLWKPYRSPIYPKLPTCSFQTWPFGSTRRPMFGPSRIADAKSVSPTLGVQPLEDHGT